MPQHTSKSIAAHFESYRRDVMSPDAGPDQVRECRRAFFAGFHAMFWEMFAVGTPSVSEEEGIARMDRYRRESDQFAADVKAGRA